MRPALIYRIVAVLLLLYTAGHTIGFSRIDPTWGVDEPIRALQTTRFVAQGTPNRTYWGFYLGFGYFCSILLLFAAALAWQLGGIPRDMLGSLSLLRWSFAIAFGITALVTWRYFFTAPMIFSLVITIGLVAGAWLGGVPSNR